MESGINASCWLGWLAGNAARIKHKHTQAQAHKTCQKLPSKLAQTQTETETQSQQPVSSKTHLIGDARQHQHHQLHQQQQQQQQKVVVDVVMAAAAAVERAPDELLVKLHIKSSSSAQALSSLYCPVQVQRGSGGGACSPPPVCACSIN